MNTAKGNTGTVTFDGQFVTIARETLSQRLQFGRGEKRIPVRSIAAVQLKPPATFTNGFIQFTIAGGIESNSRKGGRTLVAVQDENSVVFTKAQASDFEALRTEIEAAIAMSAPTSPAPDLASQLQQLATLRDQGILTEEELQAKKADILSRM